MSAGPIQSRKLYLGKTSVMQMLIQNSSTRRHRRIRVQSPLSLESFRRKVPRGRQSRTSTRRTKGCTVATVTAECSARITSRGDSSHSTIVHSTSSVPPRGAERSDQRFVTKIIFKGEICLFQFFWAKSAVMFSFMDLSYRCSRKLRARIPIPEIPRGRLATAMSYVISFFFLVCQVLGDTFYRKSRTEGIHLVSQKEPSARPQKPFAHRMPIRTPVTAIRDTKPSSCGGIFFWLFHPTVVGLANCFPYLFSLRPIVAQEHGASNFQNIQRHNCGRRIVLLKPLTDTKNAKLSVHKTLLNAPRARKATPTHQKRGRAPTRGSRRT